MPRSTPPLVVFLAFANDRADGGRYLRNLPKERASVRQALAASEAAGHCEVVERAGAGVDQIFDVFQDARYRDRVAIFHFGGHAGDAELLFESTTGRAEIAHARGFADFLGQQRGLELVFLNGCSTEGQAAGLLEAGVDAVLATAEAIEDDVATEFSTRFYQSLASGATLRTAYHEAEAAVRTKRGEDVQGLYRSFIPELPEEERRWPWELHLKSPGGPIENWSLPEAADDPLFGLPEPPPIEPPAEPFKHLSSFTRADAPIFFGRDREIRDLYQAVTAEEGAPILLVYGAPGVGKSSLLAAGLLPRLEADFEVALVRRDSQSGLLGSLAGALGIPVPPPRVFGEEQISQQTLSAPALGQVSLRLQSLRSRVEQQIQSTREGDEALPRGPHPPAPSPRGRGGGRPTETSVVEDFATAWHRREDEKDRPLILVLDHVEEIYGRPLAERPFEVAEIGEALQAIFGDTEKRPRGRLLLAFSKGWLAEIQELLTDLDLPFDRAAIAHLGHAGIMRAIAGPATDPRLTGVYGLEIDDDLPRLIADDLLEGLAGEAREDPTAVAPALEILLTRMWRSARETDPQKPRFTTELYHRLKRGGILLDDFLDEQLAELAGWNPELIESGLALDVLAHHATPFGAAASRRAADVAARYGGRRDVAGLLQRLQDRFLLGGTARFREGALIGDGAEAGTLNLAHDTLAPLVRHRFETSDLPGPRAARVLERRGESWADGAAGATLDDVDLALIERGESGMRSRTADEERLVEASQRARERRHRLRRRLTMAAIVAMILIAASALVAWWQRGEAVLAQRRAEDRARVAVAGNLLDGGDGRAADPGRASLVLLDLQEPETTPAAISTLHRALDQSPDLPLEGHQSLVWSVAWNADGSRVATASADGTARVWDASDGRELTELAGHGGSVQSLSWHADGRIATASFDGTLRTWDGESGSELASFSQDGMVFATAWSPDGERLLAVVGETIRVIDAQSGDELLVLTGHEQRVTAAVWSADGNRVATASGDATARIWDAASGAELVVLRGHEQLVQDVAWSGDGTRIATSSFDGTARIWDAASGAELVVLRGHGQPVWSAAWNPAGDRVATGSGDATARIWNAHNGLELKALARHTGAVQDVAWSGDGRRLATASADGTARIWEAVPGAETAILRGHDGPVLAVDYDASGRRLLTGSADGTARIWNAAGEPLAMLAGHRAEIVDAVFSPGGERAATASSDFTARLWDAASGAFQSMLEGHQAPVSRITWSPDGERLATASPDGTARVWSAADGTPLAVLEGHEGRVVVALFSPGGERLATISHDRTGRLWSADGELIAVLEGHEDAIVDAAFSPDGRLATASADSTLRLWEGTSGALIRLFEGHGAVLNSVAFSPDGERLLSASADGTARVWDVTSGALLTVLEGPDPMWSASFSPDGRRVATTASAFNMMAAPVAPARLFDAATGVELASFPGHSMMNWHAVWSPDGRSVALPSIESAVRVWAVDVELLLGRLRSRGGDCLDPAFRQRQLGEPAAEAERRAAACRECTPVFFERLEAGGGNDWVGAWRAYRECVAR